MNIPVYLGSFGKGRIRGKGIGQEWGEEEAELVKGCCAQDDVEMCWESFEAQCFAVWGHELDEFGGCGGKEAMASEFDLSGLI